MPYQSPPDRLALTVAEAAAAVGLSRAGFYRLVADGTVPSITIGRSRRIRREALTAFLDRLEAAQRPAADDDAP